jgi:hypothetical protein
MPKEFQVNYYSILYITDTAHSSHLYQIEKVCCGDNVKGKYKPCEKK